MKCSKFFAVVAASLLAVGGVTTSADAQRLTNRSSPEAIRSALASGGTVTFAPGTYTFSEEIRVTLGTQNLTVNATGATFVSNRIDGDMFRFQTNSRTGFINFTWNGGEIDLRNQLVSTVRPVVTVDANSGRVGLRSTADGLVVRSDDRLNRVRVSGLTVRGSNANWRTAGGDSGVFINNAADVQVSNCVFIGCRDAGVYVSDDPGGRSGRYVVINNYARNCFDGFTAKRGADNVRIANNVLNGNFVGVSLKPASISDFHRNFSFTGNFITGSEEAVQFTNFQEGTIISNRIFNARGDDDFVLTNGDISITRMRRDNTVVNRAATSAELSAELRRRGF